jgi:hypothetical protein
MVGLCKRELVLGQGMMQVLVGIWVAQLRVMLFNVLQWGMVVVWYGELV